MRRQLFSWAVLAAVGCSDATGGVAGGDQIGAIADVHCSATGAACATWSYLYQCYFGPSGIAGCSARGLCHGHSGDQGAQIGGFLCGGSKDGCWQGMTHPMPGFATLVPSTPMRFDQTQLWNVLHKEGKPGVPEKNNLLFDNMPLSGMATQTLSELDSLASYTFTDADKACLEAWWNAGAKDD
jgi:hypothetical protein